jgi:hypothetical protein
MLGLAGFHVRQAGLTGRRRRRSFIIAMLALAAIALNLVLQCWVVDPNLEFGSLLETVGWLLFGLARFALMMGLILYGTAIVWANATPRWKALPLAIGLLGVATAFAEVFVVETSTGGMIWDLAWAMSQAPWGPSWILLGYALVTDELGQDSRAGFAG